MMQRGAFKIENRITKEITIKSIIIKTISEQKKQIPR